MASKYWIKIYHEILDDPKMGRMPDRLWRRTIELFLVAGETDAEGLLPKIGDMAYRLRLSEDELTEDLVQLDELNIVHRDGENWVVTRFAERQAPVSDAERMRRYRERLHKEEYYGDEPVTDGVTNRSQIRIDKSRVDESGSAASLEEKETALVDYFCNVTGIDLPFNPGTYADWLKQVGEWVDMGVTEQEVNNAIEVANKKNMTIVRPGSLTGFIRVERASKKNGNKLGGKKRKLVGPDGKIIMEVEA
jgi:hypothetical protein